MSEFITSGAWRPKPGEEDAFIAAWGEFAAWASGMEGAGTLRLMRDLGDPSQFLSTGIWGTIEQVHAWKASAEFRPRMGRVQQYVAQFTPAELQVIATADAGAVSS
jgi:heme-degrading monooxygenase HmoA